MDATLVGDVVRAGPQAREQFYDARGYGRPHDGGLELAPVEAAHLLYRDDLESVDGMGFQAFLGSAAVSAIGLSVYKDLRDRGFYLSPAREGWVDPSVFDADSPAFDFAVYPRGAGPWDDTVAYRIAALSERTDVPIDWMYGLAASTPDRGAGVLAVVDEESELTYLELSRPTPSGSSVHDLPSDVSGTLLSDRVLVSDPPAGLHQQAFFGQPLDGEDASLLLLSLVEAAYLTSRDAVVVDGGATTLRDRGRSVEGQRFDRRYRVYAALRSAGIVPKTGFKFGADFRTYEAVDDVDHLGHSQLLVRVVTPDYVFAPRDLALDVRLAHGVRKRMVYAVTDDEGPIEWLSVERLTP